MKSTLLYCLAAALVFQLSGCGGEGAGSLAPPAPTPEPPAPELPPMPDASLPWLSKFNHCAQPRSGLDPVSKMPYPDLPGSLADELSWVRSWVDETYLWYREVPASVQASGFSDPVSFFNALKTPALTASGREKDRFHFTYPSSKWHALSGAGLELGYGMTWQRNANPEQPRVWLLTLVEPGSAADRAGLRRGDRLLAVDDNPVSELGDSAVAARFNAGLFPVREGESHQFLLSRAGQDIRVVLLSASQSMQPVSLVKVLETPAGKVGYLSFTQHNAVAERQLIEAIGQFKQAGINDLVLDMRYNGGGLLAIANELAFMIAGPEATAGKVFEQPVYNDKTRPQPAQKFLALAAGFPAAAPVRPGTPLPSLGLKRVTVLTSAGTCSASESLINSLRGVDIEVDLIGATTCGKPYAFIPTDNCGTTYFTIQFQGVNQKGFGDYADGFAPQCERADDLDHALGDPAEQLLSTALNYRERGSCAASLARRKLGAAMQLVRPPVQELSIYPAR